MRRSISSTPLELKKSEHFFRVSVNRIAEHLDPCHRAAACCLLPTASKLGFLLLPRCLLLFLLITTTPAFAADPGPRVVVAPAPSSGEELHVELHLPARVELSAEEDAKAVEGAEARLHCVWRLPAGATLYSAKWYKDGHEFLRYMPAERPPLLTFPAPGINLQEGTWSPDVVNLRNLSVSSGGLYRCEVSTEGPAFHTAFDQQHLNVVAPPPGEPRVMGVREAYAPGDTIEANCTARRSHPPPHLTWYINGIKAERWFPGRAPTPLDSADWRGLIQRTLPLRLRVERRLFLGAERRLRLRCEATTAAAGLRWESLFTPHLITPDASLATAAAGTSSGRDDKDGGPSPAARQTEPRARARTPAHDDAGSAADLRSTRFTVFSLMLPPVLAFIS